ncbi:MAG TPA: 3-phosphoserine/phosphohydroxythreonine transaminase [Lentisphaeria bacterium]|nr:MAG: phosphoserine transaminase [Lentisphaerae bacterium GWF2_38_69]HBM15029.1 3-phosphoserine/phosphohydroxythreonine transaminase [Lentisphaeria bacterium]
MTKRAYNFGAGPCTLPLPCLEEAQSEFLNYMNSGMSVVEMSHRSKEYDKTHSETMDLAKEVFGVPDDFEAIFVQGGATLQFAMIPMNLLTSGKKAAYICCGEWSGKAFKEAKIFGEAYPAWDGKEIKYSRMPNSSEIIIKEETAYLHMTSNETIGGIRNIEWPEVNIPVVADMSSDFMSRPIPWEKFDMVYGGVQKNLGPSGMALCFVRKSMLDNCRKDIATYLRYDIHVNNKSLYNTPPVFSIYIMGKVLKWMKAQGGLKDIEANATRKANLIYGVLDNSGGYYRSHVEKPWRSIMNVVFRLPTEALEEKFLKEAKTANFVGLKGHKSVGGCRASCYNAVTDEAVYSLRDFMEKFQKENPA